MDTAPDYGSGEWGFESLAGHFASVAQSAQSHVLLPRGSGVRIPPGARKTWWRNWQARRIQAPVSVRTCGFNSHPGHAAHYGSERRLSRLVSKAGSCGVRILPLPPFRCSSAAEPSIVNRVRVGSNPSTGAVSEAEGDEAPGCGPGRSGGRFRHSPHADAHWRAKRTVTPWPSGLAGSTPDGGTQDHIRQRVAGIPSWF